LSLVRIKDLQIVNGGQTTASLATAARKGEATLDGVFVQMKLSVIPPAKSGEVIPKIARYANNQNKVSDADFFSNHEFHRRMEEISRRLWAPAVDGAQHETHWFYERARGQYVNEQASLTKAEKARFLAQNPRAQLIDKTSLAKVENSVRGFPHVVRKGLQKNFVKFADWVQEEWERDNSVFNEEYFRRAAVHTILFRCTERLLANQEWYEGGLRVDTVTYTIAKLFFDLESLSPKRVLDYTRVWTRQQPSSACEAELSRIAREVYAVITHPPTGIQLVGEWTKKEQCWKQVASLPVALSKAFVAELIDATEAQRALVASKTQQEADNRMSNQIKVVTLGKKYWSELASWAHKRKLANGQVERLLAVVLRIPSILPSEEQSAKLLDLKVKMEEEGFPAR
jgi:hypothetical protein